MKSVSAALQTWLESFGWPVYGAGDVPANTEYPYITYPVKEPEHDRQTSFYIQLWAYTKENEALMAKGDEISAAVFRGVRIPCDGGLIVLYPDTPLSEVIPAGRVRRVYLRLVMNAYHCPGV